MNFVHELHEFRTKIDQEITTVFDQMIADARATDRFTAEVLTYVKKTVLAGGKRLRPALLYYGYLAAGGRQYRAALKAAVSVELIHTFLLMHDDIIDHDDLRHGVPTVHARYGRKMMPSKDATHAAHFGSSVGIVIGDLLCAQGVRVLSEASFPPERVLAAVTRLQEIITQTVTGELQDVYAGYQQKASVDTILSIYHNKTACYTFEGPLQIGMLLAGGSQKLLRQVSKLALPLGSAFQAQDDLLGVYGDEQTLGKPVGSDVCEGKMTLLVTFARKKLRGQNRKTFDALFGKEDLTTRELNTFRILLQEQGITEHVQAFIGTQVEVARTAALQLDIPRRPQTFLFHLIDYLEGRNL